MRACNNVPTLRVVNDAHFYGAKRAKSNERTADERRAPFHLLKNIALRLQVFLFYDNWELLLFRA